MNHMHFEYGPSNVDRPRDSGTLLEHGPRRSGVLVAVPDVRAREEMMQALERSGMAAEPAISAREVLDVLERALERGGVLPEVFVLDVCLLDAERERVLDALEEAGCCDNVIVILSGSWPRGLFPVWLDPLTCLHDPVPMPIFVEEVARLASPASVRCPPVSTRLTA
jgi:hypothetical protein